MAIVRSKKVEGDDVYRNIPIARSSDSLLEFAAKNNIQTIPLDVERLAESLGVNVVYEQMDDNMSGFLEKRRSGWVIGVNSLHHPKRQKFTLAHELSHYILHSEKKSVFKDEIFLRRNEKRDVMELEADALAGELLMPNDVFRSAVKSGKRKLSDLSDYFGTSMLAIKYKAKLLGYKTK